VSEVQRRLAHKAVDWLREPAVWILDETSFPKAGEHSVGVARQYCGSLGKVANCQVAVSLHWGSTEASCPISWRLYLPQEWLEDPSRAREVGLPPILGYKSKTDLALELIDQARQWELPALPMIGDSAYGNSFEFRAALRQRHCGYVMGVEPSTVVWTKLPAGPLPPSRGRGRPRQYPPLASLPEPLDLLALAKALPTAAWRSVTWRQGSRGPQCSRFALVQVWAAHGWRAQRHPPRVAEWLLIEWPDAAEQPTKYWLGWMKGQAMGLRRWVALAHARWRIEQDYRELKEELGLDHYEGRHWLGWHHHVTLVSMAFVFLRWQQACAKKNS
jgi:SRSO17 transposase